MSAYMGGTRGLGVFSACDEMSVVRGIGGVCHMWGGRC